jgi:CDGSH-type Zn-finger protein
VALCRCGASQNKPFCDNSHKSISFSAQDALANNLDRSDDSLDGAGELSVSPSVNGPLLLNGEFVLYSCDGETLYKGKKAALCRCGSSSNKPFCDGTHNKIGFMTESEEKDGQS